MEKILLSGRSVSETSVCVILYKFFKFIGLILVKITFFYFKKELSIMKNIYKQFEAIKEKSQKNEDFKRNYLKNNADFQKLIFKLTSKVLF